MILRDTRSRISLPLLICFCGTLMCYGSQAELNAAENIRQQPADLRVEKTEDRLSFFLKQTRIVDYVFKDPEVPRPYFCHVRTPSGIQVTRNHPPRENEDATDHIGLHPGIWLSFGDISGNDYWRFKARTEHVKFLEQPTVAEDSIRFVVLNRYLSQDGLKTVCMETQTCRLKTTGTGYRIELTSEFRHDQTFAFGDQEEMGLGLRIVTPLAVNSQKGGRILDSAGRKNGDEVWGKTADWCDYAGPLNNRWIGMTIMSSSANFRPSWSHARDYGFIAVNPFGRKAFTQGEPSQIEVKPGEQLKLRFAVEIHETATEPEYSPRQAFEEFSQ